eukprot:1920306-Rhodomonas_salina.2
MMIVIVASLHRSNAVVFERAAVTDDSGCSLNDACGHRKRRIGDDDDARHSVVQNTQHLTQKSGCVLRCRSWTLVSAPGFSSQSIVHGIFKSKPYAPSPKPATRNPHPETLKPDTLKPETKSLSAKPQSYAIGDVRVDQPVVLRIAGGYCPGTPAYLARLPTYRMAAS